MLHQYFLNEWMSPETYQLFGDIVSLKNNYSVKNVGIWSKWITFKEGKEVIEEAFSRGDDTYSASWRVPKNLPDEEYEWGVIHFILREK